MDDFSSETPTYWYNYEGFKSQNRKNGEFHVY